MKWTTNYIALLSLTTTALAGLEDAKFSLPLTPANFDSAIAAQSEGTLTAFFAPWCGHCKSLEPTWTKVAQAFDGDDRCKLAHVDADEHRELGQRYGVSGFPTLKFLPSGGREPVTYNGARSEQALLEFMNEQCGTHKLSGGALSDLAGRIPSLDKLASVFMAPTTTRPAADILASASALASSLTDQSSSLAAYYLKVMTKWSTSTLEETQTWLEKEQARLGKLASRKGAIAGKKLDELRMKQNILAAFKYVEEAAEGVVGKAERVVDQIKQEL